MNEGLTTPPRLCQICGELELVEYRSFRRDAPILRAWPVKALKVYNSKERGYVSGRLIDWQKPRNSGWGLFLNRIDPNFTGPYCCGDCILTNTDKCIAILGGKPTTDEVLSGPLRDS